MSDLESTNLKLPYLAAAQAQKHVTHNEALRRLDAVVQLGVIDTTLTAPPEDPAEGARYIVAADATGAWEGEDGAVAAFTDGAWEFAEPGDGWLAFDIASETLLVRFDGAWQAVTAEGGGGGGGDIDELDQLGINTSADATNKLAVRSEAVLLTGIASGDGGSGDVRLALNKEADGDTASLVFQSGWSGRAEFGLAGDADFTVKVSPDGSAWVEAIRVDKDTGLATILYDNGGSGLTATTIQDAIDEVAAAGGAVSSVFGRTGAVVAASGDYDASDVGNDSGVAGSTVKDALNALSSDKQASDADLAAIAALNGTGYLARIGTDTWALRTILGTTDRITTSHSAGVANSTSINIAATYVGQTSITTLGTIGTGTWQGTAIGVAYGGTGQTSYTNGQLLIGNTTGNTLAKATLTAPAAGIGITNGAGSITFGLLNDLAALEGLASTGIAVRTGSDAWAQRSIAAGTGITVTNGSGASGDPTIAADRTDFSHQTASHTLALSDAGKTVEMDVGSANDLTVPPNASVAFPVGAFVDVAQYGAGATTIVAGSGVTIRNRSGLVLGGQYAMARLVKRGTDEWVASGDLMT